MPIHDWTKVTSGTFHFFHQDWTIEICRTLNRGLLPPGYVAMADQRVTGPEPDFIAMDQELSPTQGGLAVAVAPPRARQVAKLESDKAAYARKANRISIRQELGRVVAIIEVLSSGNKDGKEAIEAFKSKIVQFLERGVSVVLIDLFPPTRRDPQGIHHLIWDELSGEPFESPPADKPLTVAGYDAGGDLVAYVNPVAVGDPLPDAALFLAPGWYVNIPLEETYQRSWSFTPKPIRDLVETTAMNS